MAPPLLPSQKNECFRAIERGGLDPAAFHWGEISFQDRAAVPALLHSATGFYFGFGGRGRGGDFMIYFSPDPRGYGSDPSESWSAVTGWFNTWVKNLRHELSERDLWGEIAANRASLKLAESTGSNSTFTTDERVRVIETLARAEEEILKVNRFSSEQARLLRESVELMRHASGRMGRKDWGTYALGTLTSLVISAAFAPDQTRSIIQALGNALTWLLGDVRVLPP